mgnify:CR=1 FL=1
MPATRQVRYFRGSVAADLLKPLRHKYTLSAVAPDAPDLSANGEPAVWVADLASDDIARLHDLARRDNSLRVLALEGFKARGDKRKAKAPASAVYALLPRNA